MNFESMRCVENALKRVSKISSLLNAVCQLLRSLSKEILFLKNGESIWQSKVERNDLALDLRVSNGNSLIDSKCYITV